MNEKTTAPIPAEEIARVKGLGFLMDKRTGNTLSCDLIQQNHARVCYDPAFIAPERFLDGPAQKSSSGACHE